MTKFLLWTKCDWCSKWVLIKLGWWNKDKKDYCSEACMEHKTIVQDFNGNVGR